MVPRAFLSERSLIALSACAAMAIAYWMLYRPSHARFGFFSQELSIAENASSMDGIHKISDILLTWCYNLLTDDELTEEAWWIESMQ